MRERGTTRVRDVSEGSAADRDAATLELMAGSRRLNSILRSSGQGDRPIGVECEHRTQNLAARQRAPSAQRTHLYTCDDW